MHLRTFCLVVLAAGLLSTAAPAQQADEQAPDPRLDQKVSLDVTYARLSDVADMLSKQSGISIRAGSSERDWRVRDRHISVRAKDVRLGDLLDNISELLRYRLARGKRDGQFTYLWWQDKNQRELEATMLTSQKEESAGRVYKARQAAFEAADRALAMTEAEAQQLREKDPWLSFLGGTSTGRAYAQLLKDIGANNPDVRDLLLRDRPATINLDQASALTREAAGKAVETSMFRGYMQKGQEDVWKTLQPSSIRVMPMGDSASGVESSLGFGGLIMILGRSSAQQNFPGMEALGGVPMGMLPIAGGESAVGRFFGRMMWMLEDGASPQDAQRKLSAEFENSAAMASMLSRKSPTEDTPPTTGPLMRQVEIEKMPGMQQMSLDFDHKTEKKTLDLLTKATGGPVILESFPGMIPACAFVPPGKQPLAKVVIGFEKAGYLWELKDNTMTLRPEDWSLRRSFEIPESWLQHYRNLIKANGSLTLDELAEMALALTNGQIKHTLLTDRDFFYIASSLSADIGGPCDLLRFYGTLAPAQKQALSAGQGLSFADLNDDQYQRLGDLMIERLGGVEIVDGSIKRMSEESQKPAPQRQLVRFEFSAHTTTGEKPLTFSQMVVLPDAASIKRMQDTMDKIQADQEKKTKSQAESAAPDKKPSAP